MGYTQHRRTVVAAAAAAVLSACFQSVSATCRNISAPSSGECSHLTCEWNEYCSITGANNETASCCSCTECNVDETMVTPCYWKGQDAECTNCSEFCDDGFYGEGSCAPGVQRYDATNELLVYAGVKVPTCTECKNATCPDGLVRQGVCGGPTGGQNEYECVPPPAEALSPDTYVFAFYGILTGGVLLMSGIYVFLNSANAPDQEVVKTIRAIQKTRPVLSTKTDATDEWQSTYEEDYFVKKEEEERARYLPEAPWTPSKKEVVTAETNFGLSTDTSAWGFDGPEAGTLVMDPEAPEDKAAIMVGGVEERFDGFGEESYGNF